MSIKRLSPLNVQLEDLFRVVITVPEPMRKLVTQQYTLTDNVVNDTALHFNIFEPTLPNIERPEITIDVMGGKLAVQSHVIKVDGTVDFQFDIDSIFLNYTSIWNWLNLEADQSTVIPDQNQVVMPQEYLLQKQDIQRFYKGNITIQLLDKSHKTLMEYMFEGAFPKSLSSPKLTYRSQSAKTLGQTTSFQFDRCLLKIFGTETT